MNYLFLILSLVSCAQSKVLIGQKSLFNELKHHQAPYVLLVSIDGYRHDYNKIHKPEFLNWFANNGVQAQSLRPVYPSKTFPNHLSIVTGVRPPEHGIVANQFYAPDLGLDYSLRDSSALSNGDFYFKAPIWSLAESQGMRTANYFWPGSEAKIQGQRPTYYLKYDHFRSHRERIDQVKRWLNLPLDKRPHLLTLYFSDVDSAGHGYGPYSKETKKAVHKVSQTLKKLYEDIQQLDFPVHMIIVSDHGMADVGEKIDLIKKPIDISGFKAVGNGPIVHFYQETKKANLLSTIKKLNETEQGFKCFSRAQIPEELKFSGHSRVGDFICLCPPHHYLLLTNAGYPKGAHGWDPLLDQDMHGIFFAQGPSFKKKTLLDTFDNVHIFALIVELLKLDTPQDREAKLSHLKDALN